MSSSNEFSLDQYQSYSDQFNQEFLAKLSKQKKISYVDRGSNRMQTSIEACQEDLSFLFSYRWDYSYNSEVVHEAIRLFYQTSIFHKDQINIPFPMMMRIFIERYERLNLLLKISQIKVFNETFIKLVLTANIDEIETLLLNSKLSKKFPLSPQNLKKTFTRQVKAYLLKSYPRRVLSICERIVRHLEETLRDENISQELWIPLKKVKETFTPGVKRYFAVKNVGDPIKAIKKRLAWKVKTPYG